MTIAHWIAMAAAFALICADSAAGQTKDSAGPETDPPKLVVLVYQRFPLDKIAASGKALAAAAHACANLDVPNSWIVLDSVTGEPEVLSFDPFDSFAHINKAFAAWGPLYAAHPELGKAQAQIMGALQSQRTIVAVLRDDLSYRANRIDLSKARFLRVLEVRLHPGHEAEFAEAFQKLRAAYEKIDSNLPWAVYQVNVGTPSPAFFAFVPMRTLAQNDDLLNIREKLREAEGDAAERMQQIAREAYAQTESNLYAVSPEKSHVSKQFAAGDPEFWTPKLQPPAKSAAQRTGKSKPKQ
ncbi:MAG TPA: hypothetical protein VE778_02525 [Candidatus Bathyarchaeia archaeon]|jgi:hypothetical protein|nr:hypothetical protein [Candidatus Bathyarchaeia archaeon]